MNVTFTEFYNESLKDWFKSRRDKKTGKKFKGWVNCRTGGPCSSKSKHNKYPVCRPTHAQCKTIKHKMHKKKGPARVQWKESFTAFFETAVNESKKDTINKFLSYAIKKLGIKNPPEVILNADKVRVDSLRSMAGYMPQINKVWVYIGNRNTADIIRSLAHELAHCSQFEKRPGEKIDGSTGSADENEANSIAGVLLRVYGKENPLIYESVITESYKISKSFLDLPDELPYGFWILPSGEFIVIKRMMGHDEALEDLKDELKIRYPKLSFTGTLGYGSLEKAMKAGFIRAVRMPGAIGITYHPMFLKGTAAKKTAKDIAEFYNTKLQDDFEGM
jgi:hypothetical protein